jgi:hypothetical protein
MVSQAIPTFKRNSLAHDRILADTITITVANREHKASAAAASRAQRVRSRCLRDATTSARSTRVPPLSAPNLKKD